MCFSRQYKLVCFLLTSWNFILLCAVWYPKFNAFKQIAFLVIFMLEYTFSNFKTKHSNCLYYCICNMWLNILIVYTIVFTICVTAELCLFVLGFTWSRIYALKIECFEKSCVFINIIDYKTCIVRSVVWARLMWVPRAFSSFIISGKISQAVS